MLLPALDRAREEARLAACASNLRQLGLAVASYQTTWHDLYPTDGCQINTPRFNWPHWNELTWPYMKNPQVYRCAVRIQYKIKPWTLTKPDTDYGVNYNSFARCQWRRPFTGKYPVNRPAELIYLGHEEWANAGENSYVAWWHDKLTSYVAHRIKVYPHHYRTRVLNRLGGNPWLFADLHAQNADWNTVQMNRTRWVFGQ